MPAIPWTRVSEAADDVEVLVMASRLPLDSPLRIPSFLRHTLAIRGQLAKADGLVGYALNAQLLSKTFWTVSAWTSAEALNAFNRADPHRASVQAIRPHMNPSTFVRWTCRAGELPVRWDEVRTRIAHEQEA
jgi:hypothetical protein